MSFLRNVMVQGVIVILPLGITFFVLRLIFNLLDGFMRPVIDGLFGVNIPGVGIIGLILLIFLIGLLLQVGLGRRLVQATLNGILKIPIVRAIYGPAKQLIDSFSGGSESTGGFKQVVIIEYPKAGTWMIGFLTAVTSTQTGEMGVIYVPTAPTPNSGWVAVVPVEDIYDVDLSVDEAMSMVLSGGISTPEEFEMTIMKSSS